MKTITITVDDETAKAYYRVASLLGGYDRLDRGISDGIKDVAEKLEAIEKNKTPEEKILESMCNKPGYLMPWSSYLSSMKNYNPYCGGDT